MLDGDFNANMMKKIKIIFFAHFKLMLVDGDSGDDDNKKYAFLLAIL